MTADRPAAAALWGPEGFTALPGGNLVVADNFNDVVREITVPIVVDPPTLAEGTSTSPTTPRCRPPAAPGRTPSP